MSASGAVRFYLPLDEQLANPFFGQIVIVAKGYRGARSRLAERLQEARRARSSSASTSSSIRSSSGRRSAGRSSTGSAGPTSRRCAALAQKFAGVVGDQPACRRHRLRLERAGEGAEGRRRPGPRAPARRHLAGHRHRCSTTWSAASAITQVRDSIYLIDVVGARRATRARARSRPSRACRSPAATASRSRSPSIATIDYELEQPLVWRRNRLPTITLQASVVGDAAARRPWSSSWRPRSTSSAPRCPPGYSVAVGGAVEESAKGEGPIAAVVPLMLFLMATILMLQLQSFQKLFLVVSVAPLGLIGVVAALLLSGQPLGFVAILGVLALIGIIIRNSVILMTQIDAFREQGLAPWAAVVEATQHRMRPILLTAAAASLGMIPIAARGVLGPDGLAMIGGIIVATVLTLLFLPALYVAWYRIKEPRSLLIGPRASRPAHELTCNPKAGTPADIFLISIRPRPSNSSRSAWPTAFRDQSSKHCVRKTMAFVSLTRGSTLARGPAGWVVPTSRPWFRMPFCILTAIATGSLPGASCRTTSMRSLRLSTPTPSAIQFESGSRSLLAEPMRYLADLDRFGTRTTSIATCETKDTWNALSLTSKTTRSTPDWRPPPMVGPGVLPAFRRHHRA